MDEPKYFRCNNKKRHLVSVFVCLHKKCNKVGCGFHNLATLSGDKPRRDLPIPDPIDRVEPIKKPRGIKAKRGYR